jgi:hypothetical protein
MSDIDETEDAGAEGGDDQDTVPAKPSDSDTPAGDTDQHSEADSPPAQTET